MSCRLALAALSLLTLNPAAAAEAGPVLQVTMDQARIVEVSQPAGTVIVGNPAIVDAEVLASDRIVLTGRSYGMTNIIVLDREGRVMMDEQLAVKTAEEGTVRVYRQAVRQTLACAPQCEPTVTIGDHADTVLSFIKQYQDRQNMAVSVANGQ